MGHPKFGRGGDRGVTNKTKKKRARERGAHRMTLKKEKNEE